MNPVETITADTPTFTAGATTLNTSRQAMWVLRLMYAPTSGTPSEPIDGRRTLFNGLIIATDTLDNACNRTLPFTFTTDKWGVLLDNFNSILEVLETDGLVRRGPSDTREATYHLTYRGMCLANELYRGLPETQQNALEWTRTRHMSRESGALLSFVYRQYVNNDSKFVK